MLVALTAGTVRADDGAADRAFERGREALAVGNYKEACAAFGESHELAPSPDAQFHLALCSEQLGKLGTALALHRELSRREDFPRHAVSAELAAELEARAPRLELDLGRGVEPGAPAGLVVEINGVGFTRLSEVSLDLGPNRVVVTAPGFHRWTGDITATVEREVKHLTIDLERRPVARSPRPLAEPARPSSRRTIGLVTLVAGTFALGGGFTSGVLAQSRWEQAQDLCPDGVCRTATAYAQASELRDEARVRGDLATVLVIAGGVVAVGGLVLWATAPQARPSVAIAPSVSRSSASLTVGGWF